MKDDGIMQSVQDIFRDGDVVRGTIGWIDHPEFVHGDDMHCFQVGISIPSMPNTLPP